jgi:surface protein
MFESATSFNQEGLSKWDTSAVTTMKGMFNGASIYVMEIYPLGTSLCSKTDMNMSDMFFGALYHSTRIYLCAWKDNFPHSNAYNIFLDSGCTLRCSPQIEQRGPFCASDCTNDS